VGLWPHTAFSGAQSKDPETARLAHAVRPFSTGDLAAQPQQYGEKRFKQHGQRRNLRGPSTTQLAKDASYCAQDDVSVGIQEERSTPALAATEGKLIYGNTSSQ